MARENTNSELWRRLTGVLAIRPRVGVGAVATTTTGATALGATTLAVSAITTFANGDPILIVSAAGVEANELNAAPASLNLPLRWKTALAHPSGAQIIRAEAIGLGRIESGGVTLNNSQQTTDVGAADQLVTIARLPGQVTFEASLGLYGFNIQNVQFALGSTESEQGTGTLADPHQALIDGNSVGTQGLQVLRCTGVRIDGKTVFIDLNEAKAQIAGQTQLNSTTPANIPVTVQFTSYLFRIWA